MNAAINAIGLGFRRYNTSLISNPYRTKMITAGIIFGTADVVCQKFLEKPAENKGFDYRRFFNMVFIGSCISAPLSHLWYCKLANQICSRVTMNAKLQPWVALAADQILYTPISISVFLFMNEYMKDFSSLKAIKNVREKFVAGMITNFKMWPPIVLVNFALVPVQLRVLFINVFGFFWTIYLSHLQNSKTV